MWDCLTAPSHRLNRCWLLLIVVITLGLLGPTSYVMNNDDFEEIEIFYTVRNFFLVVCDKFHLHIAHWPFVLCRPLGHRCILSYGREMFIWCMCYSFCGWFGGIVLTIFLYFLHLFAVFHRIIIWSNINFLLWGPAFTTGSGGRLNKKDGLTRYGYSHVKDKTS